MTETVQFYSTVCLEVSFFLLYTLLAVCIPTKSQFTTIEQVFLLYDSVSYYSIPLREHFPVALVSTVQLPVSCVGFSAQKMRFQEILFLTFPANQETRNTMKRSM